MAFKNLAKFVKYEEKDVGRGFIVIRIHYTDPNYQDPTKVFSVGKPEKDITEELLEKIIALNAGDEVCVHTEKDDKGFNVLVDITDKKDAVRATQGKPAYKKAFTPYTAKDETGIAVGAAFKDAFEVMKLTDLEGFQTVDDALLVVANVAQKVLDVKLAMEDKLRAKKAAKEAVGVKKAVEESAAPVVKKKTKLEEMKEKKAREQAPVDLETGEVDFVMDED